jgi:type III secretion protein L
MAKTSNDIPPGGLLPATTAAELGLRMEPAFRPLRVLGPGILEAERLLDSARREVDDARRDAQGILAAAAAEASAIVAEAHAAADLLRTETRKAALAEARSELRTTIAHAVEWTQESRRIFAESVAVTALAMMRVMVRTDAARHPDVLKGLLRDVFDAAGDDRRLRLKLHPDDADFLRNELAEIAANLPGDAGLAIVPDASLPRHAFKLETERAVYETSLASEFRRLGAHVRRQLKRGRT